MESFKLLNELDKCFPRVHLSVVDEMKSSSKGMLIVENEAWSPFVFSFESTSSEREAANNPGGSVDSSASETKFYQACTVFHQLKSQNTRGEA